MLVKHEIFIDLDGMGANLYKRLLAIYNAEHGTQVTLATAWQERVPEGFPNAGLLVAEALDRYIDRDHLFVDLEVVPGFPEALAELQELGDVSIVSAPSRNPDSATDKTIWVLERFPSINRKRIKLLHDKHSLRAPVWLEDWHGQVRRIRETNPDAFIGAISYPYNHQVEHLLNVRAEGFCDTVGAWKQLVVGVRDFIANQK